MDVQWPGIWDCSNVSNPSFELQRMEDNVSHVVIAPLIVSKELMFAGTLKEDKISSEHHVLAVEYVARSVQGEFLGLKMLQMTVKAVLQSI